MFKLITVALLCACTSAVSLRQRGQPSLKEFMEFYDTNGNGKITYGEFIDGIETISNKQG